MFSILHRKTRKHLKIYTVRMETLNFDFGVTDIDFINVFLGEKAVIIDDMPYSF